MKDWSGGKNQVTRRWYRVVSVTGGDERNESRKGKCGRAWTRLRLTEHGRPRVATTEERKGRERHAAQCEIFGGDATWAVRELRRSCRQINEREREERDAIIDCE